MSAPVAPGTEAAEPPVVPGYTLTELLGRGGSGEVWRAVPRRGGEPVAVKVLVAGDPERQAREAALLGQLDHPHLVRLLDVVHEPRRGRTPRVALVLDLLEGGSLAAVLSRRRRLRPGEVVTALAPVAAALAHAHEAGVVHGDLSPGNIVFTAEGRPVVTDLGVARVLGEEAAGEVTPAYVDPTVARGGAPGPASDVFGVAAAAFHALTGVPPWNAAGPVETLAVAAAGELPDLGELAPDAPRELLEVVRRGLAADPADRGSAAAFALDLRHACRPEPVRLPVEGVTPDELARTGAARRTELTHQVRRAAVPAQASPPGAARHRRPAWLGFPARFRGAVGSALRPAAVLVVVACVAAVAWLGLRGAAAGNAPAAPRPSSAAGRTEVVPVMPAPTTAVASPVVAAADRQEPPGAPAGWASLVGELYGRRAAAFAAADVARLESVYIPGSPLLAADADYVRSLTSQDRRVRGFSPAVVSVADVGLDGDVAALRLVDSWGDYDLVEAGHPDGAALAREPARAPETVALTLRRTPSGWRIASAERIG